LIKRGSLSSFFFSRSLFGAADGGESRHM